MMLALRFPDSLQAIVSVDNQPCNAKLGDDFSRYIQGFRSIEREHIQSMKEADTVLREYESVSSVSCCPQHG